MKVLVPKNCMLGGGVALARVGLNAIGLTPLPYPHCKVLCRCYCGVLRYCFTLSY